VEQFANVLGELAAASKGSAPLAKRVSRRPGYWRSAAELVRPGGTLGFTEAGHGEVSEPGLTRTGHMRGCRMSVEP